MKRLIILLALAVVPAATSLSKNVDLSTVPKRDTVQLTIYNSEDLTLVRETRRVTFKRGANPLQFSWANTLIDPTSVELRFLNGADQLEVLDTTYPHDKPQMLYWNVASEVDRVVTVEITYFTSGITWSADYVCVANEAETHMNFEGFVRVDNRSGEPYDNAQVRLVVGTINLVERIAQLARVPMSQVHDMDDSDRRRYRQEAAKGMLGGRMVEAEEGSFMDQKQVIKEGLSEYFIYTIEGTETIADGHAKRMRSFEGKTVPFKIQYRYRQPQYGDRLVRMVLLTNDEASSLGTTPLPDGTVRLFRDSGHDGLIFLAAQPIKYVAIGDKIELNLGSDPEVIFELVKLRVYRDNLWMQLHGANVFRRVDDGAVQVDVRSRLVGWDDNETIVQRIRNYTSKPIEVEIRRVLPGHVVFKSKLPATLHDYQTVQFQSRIEAGEKAKLEYEVVRHQGRNAKQDNVTLQKG